MANTTVITTAGARLFISKDKPSAYDLAGYEALNWTEINEITDLGEIGRVYANIEHNPISSDQKYHLKGEYDEGGISIMAGYSPSDPGQSILKKAAISENPYYLKLQYDGTSEIEYFPANIFPGRKGIGDVDSVISKAYNLFIHGEIITDTDEVIAPTSLDALTVGEIDSMTIDEIDVTPL